MSTFILLRNSFYFKCWGGTVGGRVTLPQQWRSLWRSPLHPLHNPFLHTWIGRVYTLVGCNTQLFSIGSRKVFLPELRFLICRFFSSLLFSYSSLFVPKMPIRLAVIASSSSVFHFTFLRAKLASIPFRHKCTSLDLLLYKILAI